MKSTPSPIANTLKLAALTALLVSPTMVMADAMDQARATLSAKAGESGFGTAIQGVSAFGAVPTMSRLNLPLSHVFDNITMGGAALYTELSLGYLKSSSDYNNLLHGSPLETDVDSTIKSFSLIPGIGLAVPLGEKFVFTPIVMVGWTRTEDDSSFAGRGAGTIEDATRGILFNFHTEDLLYGAALNLDYKDKMGADIDVEANLRFNQLFADTLSSTDSALDGTSNLGVLTGFLQFDGPTPFTVFDRGIRWIAFTGASSFFQDAPTGLGFDYFAELGGGIELVDKSIIKGVEGVSVRSSVIAGDNGLTGWSLGAQLEF